MTDEDEQIARLEVHRDMIGWLIMELSKEGIEAKRTTGNNPKGDILIVNQQDVPRIKQLLRNLQVEFNS
ncbi:MAG: hypothetical protein JGK24_15690 [Microcoleus sp. PH2017_29_MFU_D_A]|jgi:hypothetical protein|uniref:hypothetical protein n=2 Tax=unclassified Microcoleus TaxID=2642155 RepID=UPI001D34D6FD|nr:MULTISPECIES: hypothetical protein [unclassified Microcoleus]MCC3421467.1 hypothetical protein [Microcoleus sp. PH2017_07_MST_O_A]MCC3432778.1 hypothetical protein [Microcoleus sp. PH2017_04_SCI_O_A]MCC3444859.1 hypothetical protein [Microcoleus sp. PH2017_03_ELD_O_A]MCC3507311.1 hypothetical protein [Microcoleus sp. PH2017_19_SFW_U_A]MCC3512217.1 hypothetical protein [Microcoleus sp. PH2017_17_BER_D_A]TAE06353.1 MAG: hypothetical protein EAZ94_30920 [Oscillatoriales cyanobacterium]